MTGGCCDRLLTDNWYSGYQGDGNLQIGVTFLSEENLGLLSNGSELTVLVLPLKKATLDGTAPHEAQVFLQEQLWPQFGQSSTVGQLKSIEWLTTCRVVLHV